ncbi:MAG: tRNA adenosine(34) deaminase TadA [Gammaproteobacteria bacterium]|nr:tRNA adenosine(34) deaminase TadA [Gammaproteobacteria bacterium]MDP2140553.1 tRNA adenosine(34) deaminase TadA [Gammaproteobacteria bacterium]MDP2347322.1 tRNA adenosine(34) deaminase TadA [Gammaproteobacteria bacterium]
MTHPHEYWMQHTLDLAAHAAAEGEVPVGAVVVSSEGELLGSGFNQPILSHDPTAHAEVMALRAAASKLGNYRLPGCTLYVTIEPCTMCVGAMMHARISHLVFGAPEPRFGAVISGLRLLDEGEFNHRITWEGGVLAERSSELMKIFFRQRR